MHLPLIALIAAPVLAQAQRPLVSAPIVDVAYEVTADSAAVVSRRLHVTMTFTARGPTPIVLALPAWSPGHYEIIYFARRVSHFAVEAAGRPLDWHKLDYQTWRIAPFTGPVKLSFDYQADTIDRAVAWTAPEFTFFNGTNLFMYPVGRGFNWGARVTVRTEPTWRIATGMPADTGANAFSATNYHDLTDHPFFVGHFDFDSTQIADHWVRLAWYPWGTMTDARKARTFDWLRRIVPAEIAVFNDAPFRNYTIFLVSDSAPNGGGLEHQASQMDETTPRGLDVDLSGLYAHEFFHAWNVKRLRPADLVPYRYDGPQPSRWLWVSEGITSYYGALAQVRGGVVDSARFIQFMADAAATSLRAGPVALGDASLEPWVAMLDGTGGIYYPKGEAAGFLLDVLIRDASDNRHGLDDVMKELYDTTWRRGRGFTPVQWWGSVARAAGVRDGRFTEFARRYVDGRDPMPFDSVAPLAAMRFQLDSVAEPRFGISVMPDSGEGRVTSLNPAGAAAAAGIVLGDRIVSVGDIRVSDDVSFVQVRQRYANTTLAALPAVVRHQGVLRTVQVPVRMVMRYSSRGSVLPGASAKALRILHGMVTGTVDR